MLDTAKREADEKASEAADEEEGTDPVSLLQFLRNCKFGCGVHANEAGGDNESNTAEWVVDMEAPNASRQQSSAHKPDPTHQRHDVFSTREPPTTGPTMVPIDQAPRTMAKYLGRCLKGTISQKITWVMVMMPPPPMPWMDRPVSRTVKSWATEQRIVPTVN